MREHVLKITEIALH